MRGYKCRRLHQFFGSFGKGFAHDEGCCRIHSERLAFDVNQACTDGVK